MNNKRVAEEKWVVARADVHGVAMNVEDGASSAKENVELSFSPSGLKLKWVCG
jgi:hypothetical protein